MWIVRAVFELDTVGAARHCAPDKSGLAPTQVGKAHHPQDGGIAGRIRAGEELLPICLAIVVEVTRAIAREIAEVGHFPIIIQTVVVAVHAAEAKVLADPPQVVGASDSIRPRLGTANITNTTRQERSATRSQRVKAACSLTGGKWIAPFRPVFACALRPVRGLRSSRPSKLEVALIPLVKGISSKTVPHKTNLVNLPLWHNVWAQGRAGA